MLCSRTIAFLAIYVVLILTVANGSSPFPKVKCYELQPCTTDTPDNACRNDNGQAYKLLRVFDVIGCSSYESFDHAICVPDETIPVHCAIWKLFNDQNCVQPQGNVVVDIDEPTDGSTPCDSIGIAV